ncbi:MAG TPA: lysylphosphatidylglycerol synthase transmembrane domain-containing protein [Thermoanaerobaculia bacterium]|nr:lysylphosphatidylglycerol synthase transmembrane domain-containing protein [Thermoanaerobaculia bacterium]
MRRALASRPVQIGLSVVLAAALLAFFLRGINFREITRQVGAASAGWLGASVVLGVATFLFRALRWTWLLRPVARVRYYPAFVATAFGFAANNLPGKVGEVLRPALLARSEKLPFSPLLASVLLERVFDGASVLFFFVLAAAIGIPNTRGTGKLLVPAALLLVLVGAVLFSVFQRARTESFLEKFWRRLPARFQPRARTFAETFVDGFASLRSPRLLLLVTAGSLAMWLIINLQIYAVLRAFHLDLPFSASFVVTAAAVLGLMFPTPGGLGSYHLAVQIALTDVYGVARDTASGVALLAHAISFIPITLVGLALFAATPMRVKDAKSDLP